MLADVRGVTIRKFNERSVTNCNFGVTSNGFMRRFYQKMCMLLDKKCYIEVACTTCRLRN